MRGEDIGAGGNVVASTRITPACAGKTSPASSPQPSAPDHPRMRGEDALNRGDGREAFGSPPHARGRRPERKTNDLHRRITPACAGKTPLKVKFVIH